MQRITIRETERGLRFRNGAFAGFVKPGKHWLWANKDDETVEILSLAKAWFEHGKAEQVLKSEWAKDELEVLDVGDRQRAIVNMDGRFGWIVGPGMYGLWKQGRKFDIEVVSVEKVRFVHEKFDAIVRKSGIESELELLQVREGHVALFYLNGVFQEMLEPGRYAFWKNAGSVKVYHKDLRERMLDIAGQDVLSADTVGVRLNAVLLFRIVDAKAAVMATEDAEAALYRDAQLALRAVVGTRTVDQILADKDGLTADLRGMIESRARALGMEIVDLGIRDIILPGDMKDLLRKVTEARKAAEANLITRREETAALRNQLNSARLFESNPVLMRLKELEVLEKVAANTKLRIALGDGKLREKLTGLI